jgi:diguanylate cyclase (GGDEF)-like protein
MVDASRSSDAALESLIEVVDEGVLLYDAAMRCRLVGRRVGEIFDLDPASLVGLERSDVLKRVAACSDEAEAFLAALAEAVPVSSRRIAEPIVIARPRTRTLVWTTVAIGAPGATTGRLDIVRDVTGQRGDATAFGENSMIDALTGLGNRRRFEEECAREYPRAQRAWDPYAIAYVDVDGMTALNQTHGRAVGDEVLKLLGEALRAARREYDVVARFRDDEFAILLPGSGAEATKKVLERVIEATTALAMPQLGGKPITVSIGAAVWTPPSGEGPADTARRAASALEVARSRGPASCEVDAGLGTFKDAQDLEKP